MVCQHYRKRVPERKPDTTDQLRQGIPRRPSHIDGAGGIDCGPTGGLADGEEAAYALDRWTRRGAQMLLHARCALLNGELEGGSTAGTFR